MTNAILPQDVKADVQERLTFVEFCLTILGEFKKAYFTLVFDTKEAQHTKDIRLYKQLNGSNVVYSTSQKRYLPSANFQPMLISTALNELIAYQHHVEDKIKQRQKVSPFPPLLSVRSPFNQETSVETWRLINNAIYQKYALNIEYAGYRKPSRSLNIAPLALVYNGFRWHVRAYSVDSEKYRDFALPRIRYIQVDTKLEVENYSLSKDPAWNNIVELHFTLNPKLRDPEQIKTAEIEFGLIGGKKTVQCRECEIQHCLRLAGINLSNNDSQSPVVLSNHHQIERYIKFLDLE